MDCSICMETIVDDSLTIEACKHVFHAVCLVKWKQRHKSCPLCRENLDYGPDMFGMQDLPDAEFKKLQAFFKKI